MGSLVLSWKVSLGMQQYHQDYYHTSLTCTLYPYTSSRVDHIVRYSFWLTGVHNLVGRLRIWIWLLYRERLHRFREFLHTTSLKWMKYSQDAGIWVHIVRRHSHPHLLLGAQHANPRLITNDLTSRDDTFCHPPASMTLQIMNVVEKEVHILWQ